MNNSHQILIIGGGTAGIMVASSLMKADNSLEITIIEPNDTHYYQPAWTLVGAGTYDYDKTGRPMKEVIPKKVQWIKDRATHIDPDKKSVKTSSHGEISYEYLVIAPGLVMAPELIEGLPEALDKGVVCSNYTDPEHTWEVLKNFKGGNAVFTQPSTPIKCGGAPQKIAYLAADYFQKNGLDKNTNVTFATPGSVIFGIDPIRETLESVLKRYDIDFKPLHSPFKIDAEKQIIYFKDTSNKTNENNKDDDSNSVVEIPYDMLHLAPPQAAPEFIRSSELSNEDGWLKVDIHSLQHEDYPSIYGLGDIAALPTAKTGAAIRKQVPVVVDNIIKMTKGNMPDNKGYDGYSSCPLVTGYGKMVLAEFDYDSNFIPDPKLKQLLIFNSDKEHWRLWMLKKYGLPYLYWNKMLKGVNV